MYKRTNPAVIRAIYRQMTLDELKAELETIQQKANKEQDLNKKKMLISLYQYAQSLILSR